MAEKNKSQHFSTRVSGLWNPCYEILQDGESKGSLQLTRNLLGTVVSGKYTPKKGEVLEFRRDPGILRSQFSLWTADREWLGSALRWSFIGRFIDISTGSKPLRLLPLPGFQRGWRLVAPKSGEMARFVAKPFSRNSEITVHRRMDFEQILFAYFLGAQLLPESFWPGPAAQDTSPAAAATS